MCAKSKKKSNSKTKCLRLTNRKARRDYFVLEKIEAGVELLGPEVKATRNSNADLSAGFATIENNELFLKNVHIKAYEYAHHVSHEPRRSRRLLLHRNQINRLIGKISEKGMTLIPLELYFSKQGKIKILLGVCKGKHAHDKRETLKRKTADMDAKRATARYKH